MHISTTTKDIGSVFQISKRYNTEELKQHANVKPRLWRNTHWSWKPGFFTNSYAAAAVPSPSRVQLCVTPWTAPGFCSWGSLGNYTEVVCHSFLQWITFCQNSPLWPICLGWPCTARLLASLSYTSRFATKRHWHVKRLAVWRHLSVKWEYCPILPPQVHSWRQW